MEIIPPKTAYRHMGDGLYHLCNQHLAESVGVCGSILHPEGRQDKPDIRLIVDLEEDDCCTTCFAAFVRPFPTPGKIVEPKPTLLEDMQAS